MRKLFAVGIVFCQCALTSLAQTSVRSAPPGAVADQTWLTLKASLTATTSTQPPSAPAGNAKLKSPTKTELVEKYINQANQIQSFYKTYPTHASVREAKQLESVSLSLAAVYGDTTQDQRRAKLLTDVKADTSLPVSQRFEATAWDAQAAIARQALPTRAARLAAQEAVSRKLIAEFSSYQVGYESLLGVARDSAPERGQAIARDLLGLTATPAALKTDAQLLLDRLTLIGKSLSTVTGPANVSLVTSKELGKISILYTWTSGNSASLATAKHLAKFVPQAVLLGLNLDANSSLARQVATREKLPGNQTYEPGGAKSPLALALKLGTSPQVYLIDSAGIIRDVRGADETISKISLLSR